MPAERLILRFSDGTTEWHDPPTAPEVGSTLHRGEQAWVVAAIESKTDDVVVAILKRVPKTPGHDGA